MSLLRKSLILFGLIAACYFVGQLILTGLMIAGGADLTLADDLNLLLASMDNILPFKIGIGLNNIFLFGISAYLFHRIVSEKRFSQYFNLNKNLDAVYMGLSVLWLISVYPIIICFAEWMQNMDLPSWVQIMDEKSMDTLATILEMNSPWDLLLNLIVVAATPAICEELLFRGVLQKELNKHLSDPHIGILITSIIFSAVHLSVEGFPTRVVLGMVLGYTYYFTKNLWYPILLHLFNNGINVLMIYLSGVKIKDIDPAAAPELHWSVPIVSLAVAIAIFMFLKTKSEKDVISA